MSFGGRPAKRLRLTDSDLALADRVGAARNAEAMRMGLPDKHGAEREDGLMIHKIGARGELAACQIWGLTWTQSVNTFKGEPDLIDTDGSGIQVRTRLAHSYDLIVREDDPDDQRFVLMTTSKPYTSFAYWGWITGADAKNPAWMRDYGGRELAYFVTKDVLALEVEEQGRWRAFASVASMA